MIRTRIAPSPTGDDLHIGNAYTALINFIFAKKHDGKFIVRIEDTDRARLVECSEQRIMKSLDWLGLTPDESPLSGGPFAPYRQSERKAAGIYKKYEEELIEKGVAYYCFCTPERLRKMREDQKSLSLPSMYDGLCRTVDISQAKVRIQKGEKYTVRLKVIKDGTTSFTDLIHGKISFVNSLIDDSVLVKSDGFPTYHFAVVVDDYLMKISHVIRGEEWISSTPKHILLYQVFGWQLPEFAHLPLLRNPDKSKLSKRKNPVWVSWYKQEGILPEALVNYLALMGWSMPDGRDKFTLGEMIKEFKLEDIKTTAPVFDINKLTWLNKQYIQELHGEEYIPRIYEFTKFKNQPPKHLPGGPERPRLTGESNGTPGTVKEPSETLDLIKKTENLVKPRISKLTEYDRLAGFFHEAPQTYEMKLEDKLPQLRQIVGTIKKIPEWKAELIGQTLQTLAANLQIKNNEFFMTLRIALTGKKISPPLNESMEILGKDKVLQYLKKAIENAV